MIGLKGKTKDFQNLPMTMNRKQWRALNYNLQLLPARGFGAILIAAEVKEILTMVCYQMHLVASPFDCR